MNFKKDIQIISETEDEIWAYCPFHEETKPSFLISKTGEFGGYYKCFGCGKFGKASELNIQRDWQKTQTPKPNINWEDVQKELIDNLNKTFGIEIKLTKGYETIVDEKNYNWLDSYFWYALKTKNQVCAARTEEVENSKWGIQRMARQIMGCSYKDNKIVDHINNDELDNRECNLRIINNQQNTWNGKSRGGYSKYKGVTWTKEKRKQKWISQIKKDGKHILIGRYKNEIDAAKAYDKKAIELFGDFANINFSLNEEYRLKDFSNNMNVSIKTLRQLGIGWNNSAFTYPMFNKNNQIVGIQQRYWQKSINGLKINMNYSKLGLFVPQSVKWEDYKTIFITEGFSDLTVLLDLGVNFRGIGRPNALACIDMTIKWLERNTKTTSKYIIIADADEAGINGARELTRKWNNKNNNMTWILPLYGNDLKDWIKIDGEGKVKECLEGLK